MIASKGSSFTSVLLKSHGYGKIVSWNIAYMKGETIRRKSVRATTA